MSNDTGPSLVDGKQVLINPGTGKPDLYIKPNDYARVPPKPSFDREAHFNYVFKLIEEGKY